MLRIDVRPAEEPEPLSIHVDRSYALVGRATFADVRIPYPIVSSRHLELERRDGRWYVRDVGSSNGTDYEGVRMAAGDWQRVVDGMSLFIVDLELTFVIVDDLGPGLTLAESGSLVRKLVLAAADVPNNETAFLEVMEGEGVGGRVRLHDDLTHLAVGDESHPLAGFHGRIVIGREDERFTLEEGAQAVNGEPFTERRVLTSGDRISADESVVLFWDPLEELLDELAPSGVQAETEAATDPVCADAAAPSELNADNEAQEQESVPSEPAEVPDAPDRRGTQLEVGNPEDISPAESRETKGRERGLGLVEVALILFSLGAFAAASAVLWVFFG